MKRSRTCTAFVIAVIAPLAAACKDDGPTASCRAVLAGRVATAGGAGVANATVTLRDTLAPGGVPILTATSNASGEFGAVLNGACATCAATVVPPAQFQLPAGTPARVPAALVCNQTLELNFTVQPTGGAVD